MERSFHTIHHFVLDRVQTLDVRRLRQINPLLLSGVLVLGGAIWAIRDYNDWVGFGTGGTPATPRGWLRVTRLRVASIFKSILGVGDDLRDPSAIPRGGPKYLPSVLPTRKGGHPQIKPRTLPQRQIPDSIPSDVKEKLFNLIKDYPTNHPSPLHIAPSKTEGGSSDAIYLNPGTPSSNPESAKIGYEIAHAHHADCSLHVNVSPEDARTILQAAWGRRFAVPAMAPSGWIMIYAPRDEGELEVITQIVDVAVQWAKGSPASE